VLQVLAGADAAATGRLTLDGHIEPLRQATLASQIQGNVTRLAVKAGDTVRAGQLIARIDERETQAGLQRSEAALSQAEAQDRNARLHLDRTRELRAQGFVSQAALDEAQTQWRATQAGVQQARAGQAQAQIWRGHAQLSAPFEGVVLATHLQEGDLAAPGRPVATLYAPGALRAVAQVPASRASLARGATRIEVELPGRQRVTPTRGAELSTADPVTQTVEWRLDLPAAALAGLHPGQTVRVHFAGASAGSASPPVALTLRIPATAVLRRGELTAVYVAQGPSFSLRTVRLGPDRGDAGVEVVAGLRGGERIAVDALKAGLSGATPAAGVQP
jgi:RND family efflux transporter MFP subunit